MKAVNAPLNIIEISLKSPPLQSAIAAVFRQVRLTLARYLAPATEPYIWQEIQRDRTPVWYVYDPHRDRTFCFTSESEVRIWIENRYSQ
ncbi:hypothetical protein H6G20_22135 [Desertifilum sp. FACHB-1129]|uniref:Uncharacterized protein n=2 Tax=Desertifilum tharense IPPAS B-1220 TaxID=1781255 RepID=A0A1E5QQQ3_9CYAN|nr:MULTISPECIES: hypothetical protein [Desertifilum]MDA0213472.1 hypothetical protein [Cyanobacteria bacterium FC1]MBD2314374.1 hypothetical protein [Desertifilum sp. FACHB-1129]MBD2323307.1 hypothetical protein [Desertifilum sp. FACHB-866]MBD2333152.1 hypothetical protein [Desertifilum sp. FACHB-868]OEJ76980.1 hypothetical protein BH720_01975 [Desertifilum tharense IPPAS B-1220]